MILATDLIDDVKEEFEGGNSLSVNWDITLRKAIENVMEQCRPETTLRRVPIYGGLMKDLAMYYAPTDVLVPSALYNNDGSGLVAGTGKRPDFKYLPPKQFYAKQLTNSFTIQTINGVKFLIVNKATNDGSITIDAMDTVGTKTGGTPTLNEHNYLTGSASVQFTATTSGVEMYDTFTTAIDISDYLNGTILLPVYLIDVDNITSIKYRLKTDNSNYYELTSTADSIGDSFVDGWNLVRFSVANRSSVGTPVSTNITKWSVVVTTTTTSAVVVVDKMTIQKSAVHYFEYYSNKVFVDATSNDWKSTVDYASGDSVNIDRDLRGILHYEMCLLVQQSSTNDKVDGQATTRFTQQLKRKYQAYWAVHPSSEEALSYSKSPEIAISQDSDMGSLQDTTESLE